MEIQKILVIQTAFIGDAILASALLESIHDRLPDARIDLMVRKGNEVLYTDHPFLNQILIWDKSKKYRSLFENLKKIRKEKYDLLLNVQRFFTTGLLTAFSNAKVKSGFKKNPFSFSFDVKAEHQISTDPNSPHEIERNFKLIDFIPGIELKKPKLYPAPISLLPSPISPYITISPASVWFTKQWPPEKWAGLIDRIPKDHSILLLGGPKDVNQCKKVVEHSVRKDIDILAGKLGLLDSAALMKGAKMNYVNDSAPLHLASSVNAPVTAVFCSTVPAFGFGPLSDVSSIAECKEHLSCRPCGLHGKRACPEGHFRCSEVQDVGFGMRDS